MSGASAVLVSGGSGAIGGAVCALLAGRGFVPYVGYGRNAEAARAVAGRTKGVALALDLADTESIDRAAGDIAARAEPLAGVVLAASPYPEIGPFGKITAEQMERQWRVNVLGPQRLLAELVRRSFRERRQGSVVAVLSGAMGANGAGAAPGMGAYTIAKYGLEGVLAVLAADCPWLRVRTVKPGFVETPMLTAFDDRFLDAQRAKAPFLTAEQAAADIVAAGFPA